MVLVVDNYDSFTYNLVQYIGELGGDPMVVRNDAIGIEEAAGLGASHLVFSPGPCTPDDAGITLALIARMAGAIPILGVCLGHQAIGQVFGARVVRAARVMHGKVSPVHHDGTGLHRDVPEPFVATRYHSLTLQPDTVGDPLRVTAWTSDGEVMGVQHRTLPIFGLQYHPESIMTEHGMRIIRNFLEVTSERA